MAEQAKVYGSVKRYGVRYGTKQKGKIGKIEAERHESTMCPYCHYGSARRISSGIWECGKCKSKFTGKAYTVGGHVSVRDESAGSVVQQAPEAPKVSEDEFGERSEERR